LESFGIEVCERHVRLVYVFFFSSRRRHTRFSRDWSSDVCSSDLCLFDLLDGRAARMFKATSVFGKELDSLSDIVTFGIAPAVLIYNIYSETLGSAALFMALIFSISGLIRLARFNAKHSGLSTFIGMPIPVS